MWRDFSVMPDLSMADLSLDLQQGIVFIMNLTKDLIQPYFLDH